MTAGTLTSETLVEGVPDADRADQRRGPGDPGRARDSTPNAIDEAKRSTRERATAGSRGPLHGIPVLLDDTIDAHGLPTTGGSIALQNSMPAADSALVAKLKAAGAIILGKTNVTELDGLFDANMPEGYSSLGGQVLLPSDTDKTPAGSSGGLGGRDGRRPRGADRRPGDLDRHGAADRARRASPASSASSRPSASSAATASCRSPSRRTRPARSPTVTTCAELQAIAGASEARDCTRAGANYMPASRRPRSRARRSP